MICFQNCLIFKHYRKCLSFWSLFIFLVVLTNMVAFGGQLCWLLGAKRMSLKHCNSFCSLKLAGKPIIVGSSRKLRTIFMINKSLLHAIAIAGKMKLLGRLALSTAHWEIFFPIFLIETFICPT